MATGRLLREAKVDRQAYAQLRIERLVRRIFTVALDLLEKLAVFDVAKLIQCAARGWRRGDIFYNTAITSPGRINFTLAHEFGHYLLHRAAYPEGIRCSSQDVVRWDSEYGQIENQANRFAANFLMPLDDFRRQIPADEKIDLDRLSHCADRYRVSLIAAMLRWLSYTHRRAVLVVSRDSFILWSRASDAALKSGAYFRTSRGPIEIPAASLAAKQDLLVDARAGIQHPPGVWLAEETCEFTIFSEQYDFVVTLLLLSKTVRQARFDEFDELDTYERFTRTDAAS